MSAAGRTIVLTGATGFVGKVLLERLLARREALRIDRILALVRASDDDAARGRLDHEVLDSECFSRLDRRLHAAVDAAAFDLTAPDLALSSAARADITGSATHFLHGAASVEFELPLAEAALINASGSLSMLALAESCRTRPVFGVISTAYATPHAPGRTAEDRLVPMPRPAEELLREALSHGDEAAILRESGHPNTYTWSKCLAEHLVAERAKRARVRILRPSIVSACVDKPFPGWIDSGAAFAGFVALLGTGQLRAVCGRPDVRLDIVPCDQVCEEMIALCLESAGEGDELAIRHAAAGEGDELAIRHAVAGATGSLPISLCRREIGRFFRRFPAGLGPRIRFVGPSGPVFRVADALFHEWPLRLRGALSSLRGDAARAGVALRSLDRVRQMNRTFRYFTHRDFAFPGGLGAEPRIARERYLDIVCRGVYRHLLRRDDAECPIAGSEVSPQAPPRLRDRPRVAALRLALNHASPLVTFEPGGFEKAVADLGRGRVPVLVTAGSGEMIDAAVIELLLRTHPELGLRPPAPVESGAALCEALRGNGTPLLLTRVGDARPAERVLAAAPAPVVVLPISIHFERTPKSSPNPLSGAAPRKRLWQCGTPRLRDLWRGGARDCGRIHLRCGAPLQAQGDDGLLPSLEHALQRAAPLSTQELRAFLRSQRLDINPTRLADALRRRGEQVIRTRAGSKCEDTDAFPRFLSRLAPISSPAEDDPLFATPEFESLREAVRRALI